MSSDRVQVRACSVLCPTLKRPNFEYPKSLSPSMSSDSEAHSSASDPSSSCHTRLILILFSHYCLNADPRLGYLVRDRWTLVKLRLLCFLTGGLTAHIKPVSTRYMLLCSISHGTNTKSTHFKSYPLSEQGFYWRIVSRGSTQSVCILVTMIVDELTHWLCCYGGLS